MPIYLNKLVINNSLLARGSVVSDEADNQIEVWVLINPVQPLEFVVRGWYITKLYLYIMDYFISTIWYFLTNYIRVSENVKFIS